MATVAAGEAAAAVGKRHVNDVGRRREGNLVRGGGGVSRR